MDELVLSIVIPVYNVEDYINECINSILNQIKKYKSIEIILIDDGSTDTSGKICDYYDNLYTFIKAYHKSNNGLSSSRNYGLNKAKGKYVWFVDSDDYISKNSINKLLKILNKNDIDILLGDAFIVNRDRKITNKLLHKGIIPNRLYSGLDIIINQVNQTGDYISVVWCGVYKRNFLIKNKLYFDEKIIHEDELWTPITLLQANKVIYINDLVYNYRKRKNSIMHSNGKNNYTHVESYIYIFNNLPFIIDNYVKDKKALSIIKDSISKKYLHNISNWRFYKYPKLYEKVDRKQIFRNSLRLKNKIRSIILLFSKNVYSIMSLILKIGDKNDK